jgi:hypothetical protein
MLPVGQEEDEVVREARRSQRDQGESPTSQWMGRIGDRHLTMGLITKGGIVLC